MRALNFVKMKSPWSWLLLLALFVFPLSSFAQWHVNAGGQFPDCQNGSASDALLASGCQAAQAMAFIPNEIWIHQNDTVTWTLATDEEHTRFRFSMNRSQRR